MMPDMSGPELFAQATALDPSIASAFVFMTGGAAGAELSRLTAAGVPLILKPLDRARLDALISER